MMLLIAKAAAASLTAALAACSATNMFQAHQIITRHNNNEHDAAVIVCPSFDAVDDNSAIVSKLQAMKRRELLQLFLSSSNEDTATSESSLKGHWNGILLDNNFKLMTGVSNFISNRLFSKGCGPWNGKALLENSLGQNRFLNSATTSIRLDQTFTYTIDGPSALDAKPCAATMNYWPHHFALSPWSTMKDEIRLLTPSVAIGVGYMEWSGGKWNASPFLLYKDKEKTDHNGESDLLTTAKEQ